MDNEKFTKLLQDTGLSVIDNDRLSADLKELTSIADSLPKDNVFSIDDCIKLERLCIRGMNICDYWAPIIHIVMSENEVKAEKVKYLAYKNAGKNSDTKCTEGMRKALSESDDEYNELKVLVERIRGMKFLFDKRRDTFKSAIFIFKDQMSSYKISDKGNSGENLTSKNGSKYGEVDW